MKFQKFIFLLCVYYSATSFSEVTSFSEQQEADAHAELTEKARTAEIEFRKKNRNPEILGCKYVSGISTPPPQRRVVLTFDDGPSVTGTPYLLDLLKKYNIRATFFNIGNAAQAHPELVKQVYNAGHYIIGNHSWSHPDFHTISVQQQASEVIKTDNFLGSYQSPRYFRYPYGNASCETNNLAHSRNYKIVGWHVDSCDWAFNKTGSVTPKNAAICEVKSQNTSNFVRHVVDNIHFRNGGILLMHEPYPNTLHQLEQILDQLLRDGYTFGSLDEAGFQASLR